MGKKNKIKHFCMLSCLIMATMAGKAQEASVTAHEEWAMDVEMQASLSNSRTPLWLNANKYGMSSLNAQNGYVRGIAAYDKTFIDGKLDVNAGVDLIVPLGYKSREHTTHLQLQQAFVEANYGIGTLTIGSKHQPMELKNNELSSGSQCLGINARPVPQIRIGTNDYWSIPYTAKWVAVKAHMAYGIMTDGSWMEDFAKGAHSKYNKNTHYHQKAGYLRIGNEKVFPLTLTVGLEMASQFGGTLYNWNSAKNQYVATTPTCNFKTYVNAFTGMGADDKEQGTAYQNAEGNHLGAWTIRLNWKAEDYEIGLYGDHYFEDHSSMLFLDYDGYGNGLNPDGTVKDWNTKVKSRYFLYGLKDGLIGIDMTLKKFRYINEAAIEYMTTRYQCGPIYHDHTQQIADHICGRDRYYGHGSMPGWMHYGQAIGNPLYLSTIYNDNGNTTIVCNRFKAWHFAIGGDPIDGLHYRAKMSWQRGWGTYNDPYTDTKDNLSILLEAAYRFPASSMLHGFTATLGYGADFGELRGSNSGVQMTVLYRVK